MTVTTDPSRGPTVGEPPVNDTVATGNVQRQPEIPVAQSGTTLAHDTTPTPPTSDPGATDLSTNPPQGKALNTVITGVGSMHTYCVELQTVHFFKYLLPGPDPSDEDFATFAFPEEKKLKGVREWEVNVEIVSH